MTSSSIRNLKSAIRNPATLRVAGLMSGTSADGIDVAIIELGSGMSILAFDTFPYPAAVRRQVLALPHSGTTADVCRMNFVIGELFADALIALCRRSRIPLSSIGLVGSHGQTVWHDPNGIRLGKKLIRSTLQIGEPCIIAARTGITTVADFRPADIAAGGQGAPLIAYADHMLLSSRRKTRVLQNIGGIANLTWLKAKGTIDDIIAFDTGPGNMVIDHVVTTVTKGRLSYDKNGRIAARGKVNERLLGRLMKDPYLRRKPPKTTGRELFGQTFADAVISGAKLNAEDLVATVTAFTARSIADAYRRFLPKYPDEVILCGGGARNPVLVEMLRKEAAPAKVMFTDDFGIDADAKEAVSFALLAVETMTGRPSNVPAATGASRHAILGKIIPGRNA
jgi:anhydro-N-acetylmuramic acid kinase